MNDLEKALLGTDEELSLYLELIPVEDFREDIKQYLSERIDKNIVNKIISDLQKLL